MNDVEASVDLKALVGHLYSGSLGAKRFASGLVVRLYPIFHYSVYRSLMQTAVPYFSDGVRVAGDYIASVSNCVGESEMVTYWKDFIRGLPEYSALVRAKKFQEIENILTTLALHNEVLRNHDERIVEMRRALKELQHEERVC